VRKGWKAVAGESGRRQDDILIAFSRRTECVFVLIQGEEWKWLHCSTKKGDKMNEVGVAGAKFGPCFDRREEFAVQYLVGGG
jgi:hypothetical protein